MEPTVDKKITLSMRQVSMIALFWSVLMVAVELIYAVPAVITIPIILITLVVMTGYLLFVHFKIQTSTVLETIVYSVGLGIGFIMIAGLAFNTFSPVFGLHHPLSKIPLLVFFTSTTITLALSAYIIHKNKIISYSYKKLSAISIICALLPIVFLGLSIAGSQLLNNGGSGVVTVVMLISIPLYIILLTSLRNSLPEWVYPFALYFLSLTVLLMFSLRSNHIIGWDINQEYEVFRTTLENHLWKMSYYPDLDYNACLSITILPTILKELTMLSGQYIFKIVMQMLFAFSPVMVYVFAKRYVHTLLAFFAGFLFLSQTWFFEQMPGLIRQEIAFIFFIAIIMVLFDTVLTKRSRYLLFCTFTAGLVISHYSTVYVWIALMATAVLLSFLLKVFFKRFKQQALVIRPLMLVISFLFLLIWQIPVTNIAGRITNLITHTDTTIPATAANSVSNQTVETLPTMAAVDMNTDPDMTVEPSITTATKGITTVLLSNGNRNTQNNIFLLRDKATAISKKFGYKPIDNHSVSLYKPAVIENNIHSTIAASTLDIFIKEIKLIVVVIIPLGGLVVLYKDIAATKDTKKYSLIIFSIASYLLIGCMILSPYLQQYYNFTRLYLQLFILFSTLSVLGIGSYIMHLHKIAFMSIVVVIAVLFCSSVGLFTSFTGDASRITFSQPPSASDTLYIYDTEVTAAKWLKNYYNGADVVEADSVANLRLQSYGGIRTGINSIFPETIDKDAYLYLVKVNVERKITYSQFDNNLLLYNYPLDFINSNKNLIYNNGESQIYH